MYINKVSDGDNVCTMHTNLLASNVQECERERRGKKLKFPVVAQHFFVCDCCSQ